MVHFGEFSQIQTVRRLRMTESNGNWWSRPCGGREVLAIALPLVISTGAWSIMLFADRMFLLWHSADEMAAALPAGMLYWTMVCFPMGIAGYVNTFVAQYFGASRPDRIGAATWQAIRVGIYSTPLFLCAIPLAPFIFRWAGHQPEVACHETLYFQVLTFAAGAAVLAAAQGAFFTGRGVTRVVMFVTLTAVTINIVLDYVLVFGVFGFPELGIEGAAWATVISMWYRVAVFAALMSQRPVRSAFDLATTRAFDKELFIRLIRYGSPNGLQFFTESGAFAIMTLLVGRYGKMALTSSTLAFNVNAVAFVPMLGISIAASTLVGQQLPRGRADLARRATWTALLFAFAYTVGFALLYTLAPDVLLIGHKAGMNAEEFQQIRDVTIVLLRFVAAYCLFDAMNVVFSGAIKGAGDTWFVLAATAVISAIGLSVSWAGASLGLYWWWFVFTAWVCALGITFCCRFLAGHWSQMRVIEDDAYREITAIDQPVLDAVRNVASTNHAGSQ